MKLFEFGFVFKGEFEQRIGAAPVTRALKILAKPRPNYTDDARQNREQGTVSIVALFSADGTVGYVLPYKGLKF